MRTLTALPSNSYEHAPHAIPHDFKEPCPMLDQGFPNVRRVNQVE